MQPQLQPLRPNIANALALPRAIARVPAEAAATPVAVDVTDKVAKAEAKQFIIHNDALLCISNLLEGACNILVL